MAMVEDPVCGMRIDSEEAAGTIDHGGATYYFCSQSCFDAFRANPSAYVA
jgi:Cu+-exporting ATPase